VIDAVKTTALGSFRHRRDYRDVSGRDRWTVRVVNEWVSSVLPPLLEAGRVPGAVLDVGCGEQPFRPLVEASARRYVGMDVVQNSTGREIRVGEGDTMLGALQRSLLEPTSAMVPANRPLTIVTRSGETVEGRRLNEDTYTVQLLDARGRLRSLAKADVRTLTYGTASPMPSYASRLTPDEIADLVGFLASLREP